MTQKRPSPPAPPTRCCSPLLLSSPFPPLAYPFTFYCPLDTQAASFFYTEEPEQRTRSSIVRIDEEVWGGKERKMDDEADRFIRDAIGSSGSREDVVIKGKASMQMDETREEREQKRKRERSESLSSRGVDERERTKRGRRDTATAEEEEYEKGSRATNVVQSIRRTSRASPSYELNPSAKFNEPTLPFRRLIDTAAHVVQRYVYLSDIDPYLTPEPMPASHSHRFFTILLGFMAYVEPPSTWETPKGQSVFKKREASKLSVRIRNYSPNFERIREYVPLGSVEYDEVEREEDSVYGNTSVSSRVVTWLWDQYPNFANLRWVVEKSSLPVFTLFLEYVSVARFIEAAEHAQRRFLYYLSTCPSLSPRARRAKLLVQWLEKSDRKNERWELFFGGAKEGEGGSGSRQSWEWWFDDLGCERSEAELDEWELRKLSRGQ